MNKCLYCYKEIDGKADFHKKCALEFFENSTTPKIDYTLDQMSQLAKNIVKRSISVPGVQPKLSMSLENINKDQRLTVVGALGGNYILKPPNHNYPEMPENEHLTMLMAKAFGIHTVPSSLIRLKSKELSYITKRIDRTLTGQKIHMIDMFQITEAFDKYKSSMEKIGKAINKYASNTLLDELFFFELTVFSFLTGNNDMHLKNFSLIKTNIGWSLAPAYDLLNVTIVNPEDKEELALTLSGKKKNLKKEHFVNFGKELGLNTKQINGVFQRFGKNKPKAIDLIERSFLSKNMKKKYLNILEERYSKL